MTADREVALADGGAAGGKTAGIGLGLVVLASACWSSSGIFIRFISDGSGISPAGLAFWRDVLTFAVLFAGLAVFRPSLLRVARRDVPWFVALGMLSIGTFHVLWNTSIVLNGVSISTVIQSNAPVFVTVMAWVLWREPLTRTKILAIVLALVGIVLISRLDQLEGMRISLTGLTVALLSAIFYGSFSLFGKKLSGSYQAWTILVYAFGFAALALVPFSLGEPAPWAFRPIVLAALAGLVLVTTVMGFGLYLRGLRRLHASVASITSNSEVAFAAFLSYFLLGERLDGWQILGAFLVVGGVSLLALEKRRQRRRTRRPLEEAPRQA